MVKLNFVKNPVFKGNDFVIECVANPSGRVRAYLSFNDLTLNLRSKEVNNSLCII